MPKLRLGCCPEGSCIDEVAIRADERERCAKIVEGEVYKEHYRTWPQIGDGNRRNDSYIVGHCDELASAIRSGDEQQARQEEK